MITEDQEHEIMQVVHDVCNRETDHEIRLWGAVKRRSTGEITITLNPKILDLEPEDPEEKYHPELMCIRGCGRRRPMRGICPCYEEVRPRPADTSGVGWPD